MYNRLDIIIKIINYKGKHTMKYKQIFILIIGLFFSLSTFAEDTISDKNFKLLVKPDSGMWWNSEQSGTGAAMQFGGDGTWFVALYLYDEDGSPIFYTMQGQSVDYSFDRSEFEDNAYAKVSSVIHKSVNGRCLGCEYQAPETSELPGVIAEILFINKGQAIIKLSGDIVFEETLKFNVLQNELPKFESNRRVDFFGNETLESHILEEMSVPVPGSGVDYSGVISTYQQGSGGFLLADTFFIQSSEIRDFASGDISSTILLTNIDTEEAFEYKVITDLIFRGRKYASISEEVAIENALPKYIVIR